MYSPVPKWTVSTFCITPRSTYWVCEKPQACPRTCQQAGEHIYAESYRQISSFHNPAYESDRDDDDHDRMRREIARHEVARKNGKHSNKGPTSTMSIDTEPERSDLLGHRSTARVRDRIGEQAFCGVITDGAWYCHSDYGGSLCNTFLTANRR